MKITRRGFIQMGISGAGGLAVLGALGPVEKLLAQTSKTKAYGGLMVPTNTTKSPSAKLCTVALNKVRLNDVFWKPKMDVNRDASMPHQYSECERTARIDNFRFASGMKGYEHKGMVFNDSDLYKWVEAVAWQLGAEPNYALKDKLNMVIDLIAASQQPDGYLNTAFMGAESAKRWQNLRDLHELYCGGHMVQAAVAHRRATGSDKLLNVAVKWADCVCRQFGPKAHSGACGHPEVEMALVELFRETGDAKYLDEAKYFLETRGRGGMQLMRAPMLQDHLPIRKQKTPTGHAVRQMYLLSGITDDFVETSDKTLVPPLDAQWSNFTERKMYVTGGAGSRYEGESFGDDYELPNRTAYAETCAGIASFMWNWRMLQAFADSKYADIMEKVLYNGLISGVSLSGKEYFYTNPLEHDGRMNPFNYQTGINKRTTKHWDGCACCPPNVARTMASLPTYFYGRTKNAIYVHLYAAGEADIDVAGANVKIQQATEYPWNGAVNLDVMPDRPAGFSLFVRIPGWCRSADVAVNGIKQTGVTPGKYYEIKREWRTGDRVTLNFPMPIERTVSNPNVKENNGHVAITRGPIVYCIESADFPHVDIFNVSLPEKSPLEFQYRKDMLRGVGVVVGDAVKQNEKSSGETIPLTAIPYYAWANRRAGKLRVWLPSV